MRVTWIQSPRQPVDWVGAPASPRVRGVGVGLGAGGVAVASSGFIGTAALLGLFALAIYGAVKAVGGLPGGR